MIEGMVSEIGAWAEFGAETRAASHIVVIFPHEKPDRHPLPDR